jgi:hypothetical protein
MNQLCNVLTAVGVGAAAMYFLDPVAGNRRRALLRDKIIHWQHKASDVADAKLRHVRNRAYGTLAEVRGTFTRGSDESRGESGAGSRSKKSARLT